jgi:hypothetical protein
MWIFSSMQMGVKPFNNGYESVPTLVFPHGSTLTSALAEGSQRDSGASEGVTTTCCV